MVRTECKVIRQILHKHGFREVSCSCFCYCLYCSCFCYYFIWLTSMELFTRCGQTSITFTYAEITMVHCTVMSEYSQTEHLDRTEVAQLCWGVGCESVQILVHLDPAPSPKNIHIGYSFAQIIGVGVWSNFSEWSFVQ